MEVILLLICLTAVMLQYISVLILVFMEVILLLAMQEVESNVRSQF